MIYTEGAVENAKRLNDANDEASAGFTYGMALDKAQLEGIYSLGSVGYEPVWIIYNKNKIGEIKTLRGLALFKIGLWPANSSSYQVAKKIFEITGIRLEGNQNFLSDSAEQNQKRFKSGELDGVILVPTNLDPVIKIYWNFRVALCLILKMRQLTRSRSILL